MEHARKMVLIPHDNIHRLTEVSTGPPSVQTTGTPLSRLDSELSEILYSHSYKSERDKWTAYQQVLQRYLHLVEHENNNTVPNIPTKRKMETFDTANKNDDIALINEVKSRLNDTLIVDSVPKKFKSKAILLLRNLHRDAVGRKITWDRNGVVSIGGRRISNSNIVDLVNDAMRARKREKPVGRAHFAKLLQTIQMPREFIGNPELLQEPTPASSSTPTQRRLILPRDNDDDEEDDVSSNSSVDEAAAAHTDTSRELMLTADYDNNIAEDGGKEEARPKNNSAVDSPSKTPKKKKKKNRFNWSSLKL